MAPTIWIDDEVYEWLKTQAVPFEDKPNSVLRRVAGLHSMAEDEMQKTARPSRASSGRRLPAASGDELREKWGIPAAQARFHVGGTFYERPTRFPAALCDRAGYVVFKSDREFQSCRQLHIGEKKVNVPDGVSSIPDYIKAAEPVS